MNVFRDAYKSKTIIKTIENNYGTTIVKSVRIGNSGQALEVGFFYKGGDMNLVPSVTTFIPKL